VVGFAEADRPPGDESPFQSAAVRAPENSSTPLAPSASRKTMPALLNAVMSGRKVEARGVVASVSNRAITAAGTPLILDSSACVIPSIARAARHCAAVMLYLMPYSG
jgi:hypothetical protein